MLFLILLFACATNVRSRSVQINGKSVILNRKLYPGMYHIRGIDKGKIFRISSYKMAHLWALRALIRESIFLKTLKWKDRNRAIFLSIVLNERLPKELAFIYRLGLGHYFAISGLHLSIISRFIFYFIKDMMGLVLVLALVGLYSIMIFTPSASRAAISITIGTAAKMLGEERAAYKEYLISLLICLLLFGYRLFSLQLSFLATSVFIVFPKWNFYKKSLLISLLVSVPSLYFIGSFNLLSFIPNMLLSPLFSLLILSCFLNLIMPISFFTNLQIDLLLHLMKWMEKFLVLQISLKIGLPLLLAFYLLVIFYFLKKLEL